MSFLSFCLRVHGSDWLASECSKHGVKLGYDELKWIKKRGVDFIFFKKYGGTEWDKSMPSGYEGFKELTLDEFFKLTPEDVRVEPERFDFIFRQYGDLHKDDSRMMLTQEQIDRIKAIMEES